MEMLLGFYQFKWWRGASVRAVSDLSLPSLGTSEAWTMKYRHIQGQEPKAANKRDSKEPGCARRWFVPLCHFLLLMAIYSHSIQRYVKCMTNAKGAV